MPRMKSKTENMELQIKEESPTTRKPDWSNIPLPLLTDISYIFIDIKDYIRFGAICRLWRSSCVDIPNHRPRCLATRQFPLLMLPSSDGNNLETCSLYSFSERRKLSTFHLQVPHNAVCSSEGWLVIIPNGNQSRVTLFNPFYVVNNKIELPPLYSSTDKNRFLIISTSTLALKENCWKKAVLSANPATSYDYVVMIIYVRAHYGFSLFKSGDKDWTHFDHVGFLVEDAIYYKEQFYILDCNERVFAFDGNLLHRVYARIEEVPLELDWGMRKYLVVSSGDLLLIRNWHEEWDHIDNTIEFEVFKLDACERKWDPVNSLGDQALFIGSNSSIAMSSSNIHGCKPNSIYFIGQTKHDVGVFNMEDGKIELDNEVESKKGNSAPIWIEPTLQK